MLPGEPAMMHDGWMFGMGWTWLVGLVFLVLVIWIVARMFGSSPPPVGRTDSAEEILERRFASGEIDEAEYRSRKAALHRSS